jgi:hypothetical protein
MTDMIKRNPRRGATAVARPPREIRVRMTAARAAAFGAPPPDVWVVNGRVIRFLDPMGPDDVAAPPAAGQRGRMSGVLRLLRLTRSKRVG